MRKLSDLKKIIDTLVQTYPDMEVDVIYRYISAEEKKLTERIDRMESVLQAVQSYLDRYADYVDGDDGQFVPNTAAQLLNMVDEILE